MGDVLKLKNDMKTLHLTLKKKWFDMIDTGGKMEEYREIKPYWIKRLVNPKMMIDNGVPEEGWRDFLISLDERTFAWIRNTFQAVIARNGYSSNAPQWTRDFEGITIKEGNPQWGAEPGKKYFVIKLGERIS